MIPYAKHSKVTWSQGSKQTRYYNFEYRTNPKGTPVQSFSPAELRAGRDLVDHTARTLTSIVSFGIHSLESEIVRMEAITNAIMKSLQAVKLTFLQIVLFTVMTALCPAAPGVSYEARVAPYKGRNVIWVNGRPLAPLMYSGTEHSRETWAGRPRQSIEEFSHLGYEIIQTDLWFKYSLRPDGAFDMVGVRRQLAGILAVNPEAKIVVRINVSAPRWWLAQNPTERCRVTAQDAAPVRFGGNSAESLASEKYTAFAGQYLKRFLEELAKTPEGGQVIGFHIGGGVYGEWHYYGIDQEPDASEPMRRQFIAFARERYGSIERVNAAWRTSFKTLNDIVVPGFQRRYQVADGDFRDPQRDAYVIDYYQCQQRVVSSLVNGLARTAKETWPRPAIVGLFWGYFYGGWTVGAQASQFDIQTMLNSPYVDYFSGPYASRNMYGSGIFRSLAASVALHGKLWISEHDGGTHLGSVGNVKFPDIPRDEAQSIARMRRNFMYTLTENAGQWWYDFGPQNRSGWWSTPAMLAEARSLLDLSKARLEQPYENLADVLVVYDMASFNYVRPARADKLTPRITETMTDSLLGTGASIDRIFLMDLPRVDLSRYKLVIFGNTFMLNETQRDYIRNHVIKDGRTVVFMAGAGYTDGTKNGAGLISSLTGMQIELTAETESEAAVTMNGQKFALDTRGVVSRFKVTDSNARPIGNYGSGETAAAVKDVNGCTVYYFGVPLKADLGLFKALLAGAGVRTWVAKTVERDYVSVGGGIIAIYSVNGGIKDVKPLSGAARKVNLPPFSAQYFDIRTGASLNTCDIASSADKSPGEIWRIANGVLTIAASARDAGAVCSMFYDGMELVNDHDHGRQLQVAWTYNGLDEAYNPTEAGGGWDGAGPHSSSKLLRAGARDNLLRTVSHPAYWRQTSLKEIWRKNTALVTNDILRKTLTLGYGGDPHVLVFDSVVQISPELTGPPIASLRIEAPTLYSSPELSRHYRFDIAGDHLQAVQLRGQDKDRMNTVINFLTPHDRVPILATPDGRRAVAFYAPAREGFRGYVTWNVPSDDPTNACGKVSTFFEHPAAADRAYAYRTFIVVGDLATVRASVRRLHDQHAAR